MNEWKIKLLDGFDGKPITRQGATIGECSQDNALRDINELLEFGVLVCLHIGSAKGY